MRKRGFLTHCRARAAVQTGKDIYCSSCRQTGHTGGHLGQGTYNGLRPAAHPQLRFCSAGGWEVSCSGAAGQQLLSSGGGPRMWVLSQAMERDGLKPAACIWMMGKAGGSHREHRQRGRGYRVRKPLQCSDRDRLGWDKGVHAPSHRCVIQPEWHLLLCSAFTLRNNCPNCICVGPQALQVSSVMQVYRNGGYLPQGAPE